MRRSKSGFMPDAAASSLRSMTKMVRIALGSVALLLGIILIVLHSVDLGRFKQSYLPSVEAAFNRRLDVGEVRLSLVPTPAIRLSDLRVFDGPDEAQTALFSATQVEMRLRSWPLLKGRFEVSALVLDKPVLNFFKQPHGTFNHSDIVHNEIAAGGRRGVKKPVGATIADSASVPLLIPGNLSIRDGQFNLIAKGQAPININGINLSIGEFSSAAPFPFRASLNYPGLKTIALEGELDYQEAKGRVELKNNRLTINQLNLPVRAYLSNLAATPQLQLDLNTHNVDAKSIFDILAVFGLSPGDVEIAGPMDLFLNISGPSNALITRVRGLFKDLQVHGKHVMKGRLSGEVSVRLPIGSGAIVQRLQGSGKLMSTGKLTNADLIKRIERVTGMIGLSKDERREATTFQTMEADFKLAHGYAEFTRLYLVNKQMEVSGVGTMTLEQPTFDMAISTTLSPQVSARAGRGRMTSYFKDKRGRIVVPLKVRGPLEKPSVDLDTGRIAQSGLPQNAEKGFNLLFRRLLR